MHISALFLCTSYGTDKVNLLNREHLSALVIFLFSSPIHLIVLGFLGQKKNKTVKGGQCWWLGIN